MTTIAYHKATLTLAADSQSFRGDVRSGLKTKIVRLDDGSVVGATGNWAVLAPWVEHLNGKSEKPSDTGSSIIHMTAERLRVYEEGGWHDVDEKFAAFGSGYQVAMTAMHCGWGATGAVGMAVKLDPWSGGPVCSLQIEQKQKTEDRATPFPAIHYREVAADLRKYANDDETLRAMLSNNYNLLLGALDYAGRN